MRAQSRCRCGRGEPSRSTAVGERCSMCVYLEATSVGRDMRACARCRNGREGAWGEDRSGEVANVYGAQDHILSRKVPAPHPFRLECSQCDERAAT